MGGVLELLNVKSIFLELKSYLEFDDGSLVIVTIRVLWCRENCDDLWKVSLLVSVFGGFPIVHSVSLVLHFMGSGIIFYLITLIKLLFDKNFEVASTPKI